MDTTEHVTLEDQLRQKYFKSVTTALSVAALIGMATASVHAEEKSVTLQQIITIAKEQNRELQAMREEKGIGEAGRIRAGLYPNPVLELDGATGSMTGSSGENRLAVGVSQEFLLGGKREKRLTVSDAELLRFDNRFKDAERQLIAEIKTGYYDLILAEGRRDLAESSSELNNQLLQIARERFGAGEIAELDVNLAKVETARSTGKSIEAELELVPLQQRLLSLMGVSSAENLKLAAPAETKSITANLAELKTLALDKRPDLRAAVAEKNKGEAEVALAEAERLPNVTAGVGFSWERSETSLGGLEERNTDYLIGLRLSVPITVFDRNQAGIKEALAKKSSAEIRQQFIRQNIEREVEAAQWRLTTAEKSLNIYAQEVIPQLSENLKLVQEAYRLGEVGILSVIEEQKKFIEVNDNYLAALYNRNIAAAKLEAAVGVELINNDGGNI